MPKNDSRTKHQQKADEINVISSVSLGCAKDNSVHIADVNGSRSAENTNNFNANPAKNTGETGTDVPGAVSSVGRAGASHASGREFETLTAHHPLKRQRFKSLSDYGLPEQFWSHVAIGSPRDCWLWSASKGKDGYGQVRLAGRWWQAHRAAYFLANGEIPSGQVICHHCDTPSCCNPSHLYAGTRSDNERDKHRRGRAPSRVGSKNNFAVLNENQVAEIKALIASGSRNTEIASRFNVHHSTISLILRGKKWRHVA